MLEVFQLQLPMGSEWIWILIAIGVLIFGAKKIPELARTLGKSKGEYEKGRIESEKDLKNFKENQDTQKTDTTKVDVSEQKTDKPS
ncbi:MAG: twin-arginine translocase TatA/TatE family subunit [Thaumarchaeota archaeon]|nr:MAG: Twin-arginine translocation protein TatA [Nitrosopumilales archaeon]MCZ6583146.1 twin-arginine translocase TatA/TatE family subunit [Nitrososphaerota archaeon]GFN40158.1 MAG: twin-arginine translocation protein TatA [Marine Group I thaumarchaeote]